MAYQEMVASGTSVVLAELVKHTGVLMCISDTG